jgi:hypothetical protein
MKWISRIVIVLCLVAALWGFVLTQRVYSAWLVYSSVEGFQTKDFIVTQTYCTETHRTKSNRFNIYAIGEIDGRFAKMDLHPYFNFAPLVNPVGTPWCDSISGRLRNEFAGGSVHPVLFNAKLPSGFVFDQTPSLIPYRSDLQQHSRERLNFWVCFAYGPFLGLLAIGLTARIVTKRVAPRLGG